MNYISTRGGSGAVSSAEVIKAGLAPDGGLFAPAFLQKIGYEEVAAAGPGYGDLAERVLRSFLSDYSPAELRDIVKKAYGSNFDTPEIVPLRLVGGKMGFLELWHGPTCAF